MLVLCRRTEGRELVCLFNFSGDFVHTGVDRDDRYTELMYGKEYDSVRSLDLWPNSFMWLLKTED